MKLKILIGVLIFLILVNLATIGSFVYMQFSGNKDDQSVSFRGSPNQPPPPGELILKLSRKQNEQLKNMLDTFQLKVYPYKEQIRILDNKTYQLLIQNPVTESELNENLKKISDIKLKISRLAMQNMLDAKSILSPEQLELFYNAVIRPVPQGPVPGQGIRPGQRKGAGIERPGRK